MVAGAPRGPVLLRSVKPAYAKAPPGFFDLAGFRRDLSQRNKRCTRFGLQRLWL